MSGGNPHRGVRGRASALGVRLWVCVGLVLAVVAAVVVTGVVVNRNYHRTVASVHDHLQPAQVALAEVVGAVDNQRIACLSPQPPSGGSARQDWAAEADRATAQMERVRSLLGGYPALDRSDRALSAELDAWLLAAPAGSPACAMTVHPGGSGPVPGDAVPAAVALQGVSSGAKVLETGLGIQTAAAWRSVDDAREAVIAYFAAVSVTLLIGTLGLAAVTSRRIILPVSALEQQLHQVARGTLEDGPPTTPPRGWVTSTYHEIEHVQLRLKEYQSASRRDSEALEQEGEAVLGLHRILTACGAPGPRVGVAGALIAAEGIMAGDFVDTVALPDGSTVLVLGDVAGHGVGAGLLAVRLKCAVSAALSLDLGLRAAARAARQVLTDEDERFATLVLVRIDPVGGAVEWLNAGHVEPFLRRRGGRVVRLETTGPLVSSLIPDTADVWTTSGTGFAPGELLVLITDGLSEARSPAGAEFGEERVADTIARLPAAEAGEVLQRLHQEAERHGTDWHRDDLTVLAAEVDPD
ncbi:PP2C family protein-serine/threonine phosphatase [Streptacidiphilus albus]|uniref:PP2C family protein-serine/threonine phosphatase n=1 Tax=Streptacidiphilus albus TaxID=105425 RepID=UPI00054B72B0|nr:PP2C family protein-serine/threonine phosphatase [Streptacidiphilus albus]